MGILKNIEPNAIVSLTEQIEVLQGQVASKTLVQNKGVGITLFAFYEGEEISTHLSSGDALVQVLEGKAKFVVGQTEHILSAGQSLVMPAQVPHSVHAVSNFKMLLTVAFLQE